MPFDETTSKPFKNVSIQLILNEDDKKDQIRRQKEEASLAISKPKSKSPDSTSPRDEPPIVHHISRTDSPSQYTQIAPGSVNSIDLTPNHQSYLHNNYHHHHHHHPNSTYGGLQVPYFPIQTSPEYVDNRRGRRFRRRYNQIIRKYMCSFPGCSKSYGSLNHLNTHIVSKKHGQRKSKADFQSQEEPGTKIHLHPSGDWYGPQLPPGASYIPDPRIILQHSIEQQPTHSVHHYPHPSQISHPHLQPPYYLQQPVGWVVPPNFHSPLPPPLISHQPPHQPHQPPRHIIPPPPPPILAQQYQNPPPPPNPPIPPIPSTTSQSQLSFTTHQPSQNNSHPNPNLNHYQSHSNNN